MPFVTIWMDLEIIKLGEVSQTQKYKYHLISLIYEILKKKIEINFFTEQKQSDRYRKQTYGFQGMKGRDMLGD